jgi:hypothetical protein
LETIRNQLATIAKQLAITWHNIAASHTTITLQTHNNHMAILCNQLQPLGKKLATTWQPLGDCLVTSC